MEERTHPFSDSNVSRMLDDFLEKKIIKLPECKRPKEMGHTNNPKYCKYHRVVNHLVEKCFVLKAIIIRLAKEGKILLDLDEIVKLNYTTFTTTSLALIKLQTPKKTQSPLTSTLGHLASIFNLEQLKFSHANLGPPNEAKIKGMLTNEDGSWALVTQKENWEVMQLEITSDPHKKAISKEQSKMTSREGEKESKHPK